METLKNICGVSVFRDYQDLAEFNVRKYQQRYIGPTSDEPKEDRNEAHVEPGPVISGEPAFQSDSGTLVEEAADGRDETK